MSILLPAQRGRLSIDDEVSRYVPEWMNHESQVTIRHLHTHTSGLCEGNWPQTERTQAGSA